VTDVISRVVVVSRDALHDSSTIVTLYDFATVSTGAFFRAIYGLSRAP